jgi:DNA-binding transcriptional ArsR family regulator
MEPVFKALADRNRRRMLDRLHEEPGLTLSELTHGLGMTRQSASRHVSILEKAGLVVTHWSGREKLHYLNPVPVAEITDRWLDKFTKDKTQILLALKGALEDKGK